MDFGVLIQRIDDLVPTLTDDDKVSQLNEIRGYVLEAIDLPDEAFRQPIPIGGGGTQNPAFVFCHPREQVTTPEIFIQNVNDRIDIILESGVVPPLPPESSPGA